MHFSNIIRVSQFWIILDNFETNSQKVLGIIAARFLGQRPY